MLYSLTKLRRMLFLVLVVCRKPPTSPKVEGTMVPKKNVIILLLQADSWKDMQPGCQGKLSLIDPRSCPLYKAVNKKKGQVEEARLIKQDEEDDPRNNLQNVRGLPQLFRNPSCSEEEHGQVWEAVRGMEQGFGLAWAGKRLVTLRISIRKFAKLWKSILFFEALYFIPLSLV